MATLTTAPSSPKMAPPSLLLLKQTLMTLLMCFKRIDKEHGGILCLPWLPHEVREMLWYAFIAEEMERRGKVMLAGFCDMFPKQSLNLNNNMYITRLFDVKTKRRAGASAIVLKDMANTKDRMTCYVNNTDYFERCVMDEPRRVLTYDSHGVVSMYTPEGSIHTSGGSARPRLIYERPEGNDNADNNKIWATQYMFRCCIRLLRAPGFVFREHDDDSISVQEYLDHFKAAPKPACFKLDEELSEPDSLYYFSISTRKTLRFDVRCTQSCVNLAMTSYYVDNMYSNKVVALCLRADAKNMILFFAANMDHVVNICTDNE